MSDATGIWTMLCSNTKLDRDQGQQRLQQCLQQGAQVDPALTDIIKVKCLEINKEAVSTSPAGVQDGWETRLGLLLLSKAILEHEASSPDAVGAEEELMSACLKLLSDREARVRTAAGEVMGAMCKKRGPKVYEAVRDSIFSSIKVSC